MHWRTTVLHIFISGRCRSFFAIKTFLSCCFLFLQTKPSFRAVSFFCNQNLPFVLFPFFAKQNLPFVLFRFLQTKPSFCAVSFFCKQNLPFVLLASISAATFNSPQCLIRHSVF